ncbi:hypothetical protein QPK87_18860 [Kamptonema cortianum]|nr:hypothetical protein [Geitlerinema splendidum]MDK3158616.1 hypothetical protein [Kamptonema cortianum]
MFTPLAVGVFLLSSQSWHVSQENSLEYGGRPYVPIGLRIDGTVEEIERGTSAGIRDFIVDLPATGAGWEEAIAALESKGARYVISINSVPPPAEVAVIDPESYRMMNVQPGTIRIELPGAKKARVIVASQNTGLVLWKGVVPVVRGVALINPETLVSSEHVVVAYPVQQDLSTPDFWDNFDEYRDTLLATLSKHRPGSGYRGLLNPFGKVPQFPNEESTGIPTSALFRLELESFIQQKYGSVETTKTAWKMSLNDMTTAGHMSAAVPLWSDQRGVEEYWNLRTDTSFPAGRGSTMWSDIRSVLIGGSMRRYNRLAESVSELTGGPVIQDWKGWTGPYESGELTLGAIGFTSKSSSVANVIEEASKPASTAFRRSRPTACWATDLELVNTPGAAEASDLYIATQSMGLRGWFFRADTDEEIAQVARLSERANAELGRLTKPQIIYYPDAARDPASPSRLPGGYWWLPSPGSGERLEFGEGLEGYRYSDPRNPILVFWSNGAPRTVKFRMVDPKSANFESLDGSNLNVKIRRNILEMDVPTSPVIWRNPAEVPVPEDGYKLTVIMIDAILSRFGSRADLAGTERYALQKWTDIYERSPGPAFLGVREQLRRLLVKAAPYAWVEGEEPVATTFGGRRAVVGASEGGVLTLSSMMRSGTENTAQYRLNLLQQGDCEVWLAGRIPASLRGQVKLNVGGQTLVLDSDPVSYYGSGLAWYKFGNVTLRGTGLTATLSAPSVVPEPMHVDVLMVTADPFRPNGPRPPAAWLLEGLDKNRPPKGMD